MNALVAALSGLAIGLGVWLVVLTVAGELVVTRRSSQRPDGDRRADGGDRSGWPALDARDAVFVVLAVGAAVAVLATTRLAVAALATALGILLVPRVLQAKADRERAVSKMRAAAEFVEAIRGSLGAGSGLEAAIIESARRPPAGLADELTDFVAHTRLPEVTTEQALRRLARRAQEPAIDLLVGSLLAALQGAAGDMGRLFERIADQGRDFAETRAQTQAERARVEFQTRVLSLLVIGVALLSVLVSPDLTEVYGPTLGGQLLLAVPVAVFALGWWWLISMNRVQAQHRFQLRPAAATGSGAAGEVRS